MSDTNEGREQERERGNKKQETRSDKEEACTRLAQLPCTGMHARHRRRNTEELLIGMLESLRVKCRTRRRQERVVRDSPRSKQKGRGDGSKVLSSSVIYGL